MDTYADQSCMGQGDALLALTRTCISRQEYHAAATHVRKALGLDPARPEALNLQGALLEMNRDRNTARKYYRAALAFDPAYQPAQINLSRTLPWCLPGQIQLG